MSDLSDEFYSLVQDSYKSNKNTSILLEVLQKDFKQTGLTSNLEEPWKKSYEEGRFSLWDGLIYHRTKHNSVLVVCDRSTINTILQECHDTFPSGHFSTDRTMERIETVAWWPEWRKDTAEYCSSCERCQECNRATVKRYGLLIRIEEPTHPWEVINMD